MRASSIRMEIMQFSVMEGKCPGQAFLRDVLDSRSDGFALKDHSLEADGKTRYRLIETQSGVSIDLLCSPTGVELVEAAEGAGQEPASIH